MDLKQKISLIILITAIFLIGKSTISYANVPSQPLNILRVTPEGEDVPAGNQIIIEFNRPVVPLGKMERTQKEVGIEINPPLNCQWRWLNTTTLSCNLDQNDQTQVSTQYNITIEPVITAEDGGKIKEKQSFNFITQRPDISYTNFKTWITPNKPQIRAVFTQPVSKSSVEKHLFFVQNNDNVRIAPNIYPDIDYQKIPDYIFNPIEKNWINIDHQERKNDDQKSQINGEEARRVWIIEPQTDLAEDSSVVLKSEKGLVSAIGNEQGIEEKDIVSFNTFPKFDFSGISCSDNEGNQLLITLNDTIGEKKCNPMSPISLAFTSPILRSEVQKNLELQPDLANGKKDYNPWGEENRDYSTLYESYQKGKLYYINLPIGLKAAQEYTLKFKASTENLTDQAKTMLGFSPPENIEDEFGRTLAKDIELKFSTNHRNPNFVLVHHDAVLESKTDSDIPLYVNNLKSYSLAYQSLTADSKESSTYTKSVPNIEDVQYGIPLGVREILKGKSGVIYGFLETDPPAPNKYPEDFRLFAQVTPWQAHFKLGHFSSIVWLTDLETGLPVKDVTVKINKSSYNNLTELKDVIATAITDENGIARLPGSETLDPKQILTRAWQDNEEHLFAHFNKGKEIGILPLDNRYSLSLWNFTQDNLWEYNKNAFGHLKSWGMTAQGIYRAGDTIQYKIFLRNQNDRTLTPPPKEGKYSLIIKDPTGKTVQENKNISFSAYGAYSGEFAIPEKAAVGWYNFILKANFSNEMEDSNEPNQENEEDDPYSAEENLIYSLYPLQVLVSDFTPAPFKVSTEIEKNLFHPNDTMTIASSAQLHSGGAYSNSAIRTTVSLRKKAFSSKEPALENFIFGTSLDGLETEQIFQSTAKLDNKGEHTEIFTVPQKDIYYGTLQAESAVQDDRGKSISSTANADYIGVDHFIGILSPQWLYETNIPVKLQTIITDETGKPLADQTGTITISYEEISVAKVKGAGNAYQSDMTREWKEVSKCEITSTLTPSECSFTPTKAGTYQALAEVTDTKGRKHKTTISLWVSGEDYVQWNDQDNLALTIIPEKKEYNVGDTAKFLIKNPYPDAQALITIERYGVIEHFVQKLNGSTPILEIPVKADYLPGFYVSVTVVSPRVEMPPPQLGQIDMGKPAFRMGYSEIIVNDPYKELFVTAKTDKEVYRPRDKVTVTVQANPRNNIVKKQPIELAIAVLDDSVFDLLQQGRDSFDPYKGFYKLEPIDIRNYSLLYKLIGRQKFEKKGANPGGDGGNFDMRNIFKFVSYWNPALKMNEDGTATFEFEVPDNLTGWRILAVATTEQDLMGLGEATFKVNRPTEIRPVMPNQIHEGDTFRAGFSIMNRTDKTRNINVSISPSGNIENTELTNHVEKITLDPYIRKTIYLDLKSSLLPINQDEEFGNINFLVIAGDESDEDATEYKLPVIKKRSINTASSYATTTEDSAKETIQIPKDIYTDTGDISITLSPSVISNVTGAFKYIRDYPYYCWEQILTKAVMASHYKNLISWIPDYFKWENSENITLSILDKAANFQAPNGSMTYFVPTDEHADPYLSAYTALAFNWLKKSGNTIPTNVEEKLHLYLLNFLRMETAPDFYQDGMKSTVRAVALAALAQEKKIDTSDILRYIPHAKDMSLFGKAHFLIAALSFDETKSHAETVLKQILATSSETSGKFIFNETLDDGYLRILSTPLRDNCAVLSALLKYKNANSSENIIGDKPFKLVRTITQTRGKKEHWENTQENIFCMNALVEYSRVYEDKKPNMSITASIDQKTIGETKFQDYKELPKTYSYTLEDTDAGQTKTLSLARTGQGRIYFTSRLRYALKNDAQNKVNAGMDITREYSVLKSDQWKILDKNITIKRGDIVRVDLFLSIPTARNFVVIHDPIAGGFETVNQELATASKVDANQATYDQSGGSLWFKYKDWNEYNVSFWNFYHQELRHDSARFYSDWLPAGNYHLSYMTQAIADGVFSASATTAEEMYDSDIYGKGEAYTFTINTDKSE